MKKLFCNIERKMIALYIITTAIMYSSFWLGWYFFSDFAALAMALALVVVFGTVFARKRKTAWVAMALVFAAAAAIGFSISAFFIALNIIPSRFWGLCLLIMLAYKTAQAILGEVIKNKKAFYSFFIFCLIFEVIFALVFAFAAEENPPLMWQIFFALVVCFFYSCGQIGIRKGDEGNFWYKTATTYLFGFVFIFALIVILVISILTEDGSAFEFLFDGIGNGISGGGTKKKRR